MTPPAPPWGRPPPPPCPRRGAGGARRGGGVKGGGGAGAGGPSPPPPPRRGSLGHMDLYASAADQIDLTVRDVRALARAALSVVQPGESAHERLLAANR